MKPNRPSGEPISATLVVLTSDLFYELNNLKMNLFDVLCGIHRSALPSGF